ncbi:MAG: PDZ domain-containing protein [Phycisphaerae bacterium]|nr:PDZ domain-containing protein [Phycisphaerae bacterium]
MTAARSHFGPRLVSGALAIVFAAPVLADVASGEPQAPLSRLVPADTGVFVEFRRLDRLQEQLRNLNAWRLIELFTTDAGGADRSDANRTPNWAEVISTNLGIPAEEAFTHLFAGQAALAAPDWQRLRYGVIVLRPPDPSIINRLTAPEQVIATESRGERVRLYQTRPGLWLATDGRVVVLSQQSETTDFYRKVIALLDGGKEPSLAGLPSYIGQVRQLGTDCAGHVYFAVPTGSGGGDYWPSLQWGVIGIHVRDQRVDLVIRARLDQVRERIYRPPVEVDRLMQLPLSTLWTWGTSVNWPAVRERLSREAGVFGTLSSALPVSQEALSGWLARLGPRIVVVWGHGAGEAGDLPQVAVLLESREASGTARALDDAIAAFLKDRRPDGSDQHHPRLSREEHAGTTVSRLAFPTSRPADGEPRAATLRHRIQPAYAPLDGWLVMGLQADHVRTIIDADRGLVPRLRDAPEMELVVRRRARSTTLSICQPALCSQIIRRWLGDSADDPHSFWRLVLSGDGSNAARPKQSLGIGMSVRQKPGRVCVSRVYAGTPANGKLQPGDEILAIDGRVLSMDQPNADLRRYVRAQEEGRPFVLRVQRKEEWLDVELTLPPPPPPQPGIAEMLERLARLGDDLHYATFAVSASRPDHYIARLTLGFSRETATPTPATSQPTTAPATQP